MDADVANLMKLVQVLLPRRAVQCDARKSFITEKHRCRKPYGDCCDLRFDRT
jgi:hypothetical protein